MTIRTDRLRQVVTHLRTGHLGHERFDFSCVNDSERLPEHLTPNTNKPAGCGTNGCAMGELPIIFPDVWCFHTHRDAYLASPSRRPYLVNRVGSLSDEVQEFFGIDDDMEDHLFFPCSQSSRFGVSSVLPGTASKEEVAANIEAFCKWAEDNGLDK